MTDPETLPGYFASNVDRAGVARMIDYFNAQAALQVRGSVAYDVLPPIEQHDCKQRGCQLVLKAEKRQTAAAVAVGRDGVVPARETAPRLAVGERGAVVGGARSDRYEHVLRLRAVREDFQPRLGLVVWPPLMESV